MSACRQSARALLARFPSIDARFRRHVWSRIHFPESEMAIIAAMPGRPLSVAIDVGAALGCYSWLLNRKAERVIAFEPGAEHNAAIRRALAPSRIHLRAEAVGRSTGHAELYTPAFDVHGLHSATLSLNNPVSHGALRGSVPLTTVDTSVLPTLQAGESVDFIKIDVEGFEAAVLEGAEQTLAEYRPAILCEIEARHNPAYGAVFDRLAHQGYDAFGLDNEQFRPFTGDLRDCQREEDLAGRLAGRPGAYLNNFLFEHRGGRVSLR